MALPVGIVIVGFLGRRQKTFDVDTLHIVDLLCLDPKGREMLHLQGDIESHPVRWDWFSLPESDFLGLAWRHSLLRERSMPSEDCCEES